MIDCSSNTCQNFLKLCSCIPALPHSKDSTTKMKVTSPTGKKEGSGPWECTWVLARPTEVHALLQIIIHGLTYMTPIGLVTQTAHNTLESWKGTRYLLEPKPKLSLAIPIARWLLRVMNSYTGYIQPLFHSWYSWVSSSVGMLPFQWAINSISSLCPMLFYRLCFRSRVFLPAGLCSVSTAFTELKMQMQWQNNHWQKPPTNKSSRN